MQCPHCGAEVLAGNTFCQRCRKRVVAASTTSATRPALRQEPVVRREPTPRASFAPAHGAGASFARPGWITLLALLYFVAALFSWILAAATAIPMVSSAIPHPPIRWLFVALYVGVGILHVAAGIGLWRLRAWGRSIALVFAFIGLIGVPIGTAISILLLVYLFRPGTKILFSGRSPAELDAEEQEQVRRASGGTVLLVVVMVLLVGIGILIAAAILIPSLLRARMSANEHAAFQDMATIVSAETSYAQANGGLYDHTDCLMAPANCIPAYAGGQPFLDPALFAEETRHGYRFLFFAGPQPEAGRVDTAKVSKTGLTSFAVVAQPVQMGNTGNRIYCADATGVVCELDAVNERALAAGACPAGCRSAF